MRPNEIIQSLSWMVLKLPFYGSVTMMSPRRERDDIPTACTNGNAIMYNPAFFQQYGMGKKQIAFIFAHEVEHIVRRHIERRGNRDPHLWNVACDHDINLSLIDMGLEYPTDEEGNFIGLADRRFRGMSAERIYNLLKQEGREDDPQPGEGDASDRGGGTGAWGGDDLQPGEGPEGESAENEAGAREAVGRVVASAAKVKAQHGIGELPAHLQGIIAELSQPRIDWRQYLRDFMSATAYTDHSWSRLNRRVRHRGLRLPSLHDYRVGPVAILLDTSGSVHSHIGSFLSEVGGIAAEVQPEEMHLFFVDTRVQAHVETDGVDFEADMGELLSHPPMGGGTDLRAGFRAIEELGVPLDAVVVLTDLMTPWPDQFAFDDRTLFVTVDSIGEVPFGDSVELDDE